MRTATTPLGRAARAAGAAVALVACLSGLARGDEHEHSYKPGDEVTLWANRVGPYHNPQETYSYYSLPFCRPDTAKPTRHMHDGLGAVLEGNDMRDSGVLIRFREDLPRQTVCEIDMTKRNAHIFQAAVRNSYWYQMYLDELPMWGMVGQEVSGGEPAPGSAAVSSTAPPDDSGDAAAARAAPAGPVERLIYTHKSLSIAYNGDRIIEVNLTSENPQPIRAGSRVPVTISVKWGETDKDFDDRFDRYLDFDFFEHQIHFFAVFNSFMMVIFLCGLVVLILMRTLRNDYVRFTSEDDDMELERVIDETGWKQVHGDVFRSPTSLTLFSVLVGTGHQLFIMVLSVILIAIVDKLYVSRGAVMGILVGVYSLTCAVAGFASGRLFKQHGGRNWKRTMLLTAVLFPGACFAIVFVLNFVAIGYQALATLSLGTMLTMTALWALVALPLTVVGTVVGRNRTQKGKFPCQVNSIRRPVPDGPWYTQRAVLALAGGILPFGSIFIELFYIFSAVWHYKFYYVYGFMLLVYVILLIVTVCVTIVSTYCLLNAEDWRWQWTAFASGASTALYVLAYSVYYFFTKTRMTGLFQVAYYYGYMSIFSLGLGILCGTVGYVGSSIFVTRIYTYVKSD